MSKQSEAMKLFQKLADSGVSDGLHPGAPACDVVDEAIRLIAQGAAAADALERAEARVKLLTKALAFYGNEGNYHMGKPMTPFVDGKPDPDWPLRDEGIIARRALAKKGKGKS